MKINFKQFLVYTSLDKSISQLMDISKELSDGIYKTAQGIQGYALALKIYNTTGEEEYTDEEFEIIKNYADRFGTPFFVDALNTIKQNAESTIVESAKTNE